MSVHKLLGKTERGQAVDYLLNASL